MGRLGALVAALMLGATAAAAEPIRAKVEGGVLVGEATDRAHVFRAVPYAAPPVGDLRWAPPKAVVPWAGERDATRNGPSCPQVMNADGTPNAFGGANGPVSEDCLHLYVFAPKAAKRAPVMVWIHGGGHRVGAGWVYDGQNFARDGVVLVSINYRLGALGYMAHPAFGEGSGNFGMLDQIAALKWVQRNIATFGGDPGNVTIFGESAGGGSVLALLASPAAKGLYHKAIVESGGGWSPGRMKAAVEREGAEIAAKAGAPAGATLAQLRSLPFERFTGLGNDWGPVVDGKLLTVSPAQAMARGQAADVPLIIGWNSGEDAVAFGGLLGPAERLSSADQKMDFTDRRFGAPARWTAAKAGASGKPAWLYYFSYVATRFRPAMTTAAHAAEIQYVFEYWGRRTPMSVVSDEDRAMATLMHGHWVTFAKTGAPGKDWPAYKAATDQLFEFGSPSGVRTNFRKAELDALEAEAPK